MSTPTDTVRPADAKLLRDIAELGDAGNYYISPEEGARLRALVEVLNGIHKQLDGLDKVLSIKPKPDVMDISIARATVNSIRNALAMGVEDA